MFPPLSRNRFPAARLQQLQAVGAAAQADQSAQTTAPQSQWGLFSALVDPWYWALQPWMSPNPGAPDPVEQATTGVVNAVPNAVTAAASGGAKGFGLGFGSVLGLGLLAFGAYLLFSSPEGEESAAVSLASRTRRRVRRGRSSARQNEFQFA